MPSQSARHDSHSNSLGPQSNPVKPPRDVNAEPENSRTRNIILFGESGVGKSSLINLIAGRDIAKVSSDVDGCTMTSTRYDTTFGNQGFRIFDTVGLEEPQLGVNDYLTTIEKAYQLIQSVNKAGGAHLLLFCTRGGKITDTMQSNYRLFHEFLCDKKVPLAVVSTDLEGEVRIGNGWERNASNIKKYGIPSVGHACITTVRDDTPGQAEKYAASQKTIQELLMNCALKDNGFRMEVPDWLAMVGRRMMGLVARGTPKPKDIVKVLTQRCGMDPETARKVAGLMREREGEAEGC
ncbi:hypothetical protein PAXINDRAFT_172042 [Paxillus involutus ATCC 200175]|uniref:G domain-containing protein n=1 Tax=Paxillus involutus ATCC 200175 TaxID=664439 RepID=A0A0C9TJA1_PAXIN|nr:hypothetical protein PAXINDRAFT_172042 [Paxillus involutus ATCC 200175]